MRVLGHQVGEAEARLDRGALLAVDVQQIVVALDPVDPKPHVGREPRVRLPRVLRVQGDIAVALTDARILRRRAVALMPDGGPRRRIGRIELTELEQLVTVVHVRGRRVAPQTGSGVDAGLQLMRSAESFREVGDVAAHHQHRRGRNRDRIRRVFLDQRAGAVWNAAIDEDVLMDRDLRTVEIDAFERVDVIPALVVVRARDLRREEKPHHSSTLLDVTTAAR